MKPAALQLSKYKAKIYLVSAFQLLFFNLFFQFFFSFNIILVVLGAFFFNI